MKEHKNVEAFGNMMANQMRRVAAASVTTAVELGVINSDFSITPDSLGEPIPKGEYMIDVRLLAEASSIQSGSRVLIAWCGREPVVVAVVKST